MQAHPIKTRLKLPGTKHLKLKCDEPLSNFAFKFNLRRYIKDIRARIAPAIYGSVGRCRLTL